MVIRGYTAVVVAAYTKELLLVVLHKTLSQTLLYSKDRSTLLQSLSSILSRLPRHSQEIGAIDNKELENSRCLLIFDNIDQYSPITSGNSDKYNIRTFFPSVDHGSILITSRLPSLNTVALTNLLEGLLLAVMIAAAFMLSPNIYNITKNPSLIYSHNLALDLISYHKIQKRDPSAAELLLLLTRFNNRDIWYKLVKGASYSSDVPSWLKEILSSGLLFKNRVKHLIGFSLLETKQQERSYTIHLVV
ncbi:protein kinase subdomain-containing protein [Penicillium longicatenatum]|nr:protein kinase subdomain-containing protein [Penicillium longicatenatum]